MHPQVVHHERSHKRSEQISEKFADSFLRWQNRHRFTLEMQTEKVQDTAFSDTQFVELEAIKRVMIQGEWYEVIGGLRPVSVTLLYRGEICSMQVAARSSSARPRRARLPVGSSPTANTSM
jgi:hypothetical protein